MIRVILDTDFGGDIDDLGALAVLHALADAGRLEIAGLISDTPQAPAIDAIEAVNRWYGRPGLPIGHRRDLEDQRTYADAMRDALPLGAGGANRSPHVSTYRRLLAEAPDRGITVVTIGVFFALVDLFNSTADQWSPLDGVALFERKVERVVAMGGHYPDPSDRAESNFRAWGCPGVTAAFVSRCPRPMTFIGSDLGHARRGYATGARLNDLPTDHPVRIGYAHFFAHPPAWVRGGPWDEIQPWSIWDLITVWIAAHPDHEAFERVYGRNHVDADGNNRFEPEAQGPHAYVRSRWAPQRIAEELIEPWMLTMPVATGASVPLSV